MFPERIEAKWIKAFMHVFELSEVHKDCFVAIVSETQSRPVNVHLAELALGILGARVFHVVLPVRKLETTIPVRSTGASNALIGFEPVVNTLKDCHLVVDMTAEGLQHSVELASILAGGARLIYVSNDHPELLERCLPDATMRSKVEAAKSKLHAASRMHVASEAGTDLNINLRNARVAGHWGGCDGPGTRTIWPAGFVFCYPTADSISGSLVIDKGDINLTFKRYLESSVTLTIKDDFVTDIQGSGLDADLHRSYFAAWNDKIAYATSHVGFGLNKAARWDAMTMYDKRDHNGVEQRAFAGNFLFSTGANEVAGRYTLGHFDIPLRNCSIRLDDDLVVDRGELHDELA